MLNLKIKPMKKLLLCGSALLTLGAANAQAPSPGWFSTGAYDDFTDTTIYVNGPNNEGAYWWENTNAGALKLSRKNGAMVVTATAAGGCTSGVACYPLFGLNFGTVNSLPVTVDLSSLADIVVDVENMVNVPTYIGIVLEDANGIQAKIEPNVSDVLVGTTWSDAAPLQRKSLNGFSFGDFTDPGVSANVRKTIKIDLSSVSGKVGGLSAGDADWVCSKPYDCPTTAYSIDATKITNILFMVHFGKSNIFISEGTANTATDYKDDTFIEGTNITPYTGSIKFHEFKLGTAPFNVGIKEAVTNNSLKVYPNPANDVLNVSFNATSLATVTLTDIFGRTVYTSSVASGANNIVMNTSDLSTGMYILNVASENGSVSSKVTIK
jgi:hypothetical protein